MSLKGNLTANLAYQNHVKGNLEKAKQMYELALSQGVDKPNNVDAYGVLLMTMGEFEKSIEIYGKALKLHPTPDLRYKIRLHRAIAYIKLNDMKHARAALEDIDSKEEIQAVIETLGYFYVITDDEKAHSYNEKAINLYPDSSTVLDNIAQYYIRKGHPEIAKEFAEEAYEIDNNKVDINYHCAQVEQAAGNREKALEYANKALECKITAINETQKEDIEKLIAELG